MILLVDDDGQLLEGNARGLKQAGFECVSFSAPGLAVYYVRKGLTPDLIVIDYHMAGMNGVQLATEIRKILPNVPILFHSGSYLQEMDMITNSGFQTKGCSMNKLIYTVRWMLGQEP